MRTNSNLLLGYLLVIATAFFTAFSYIFGKMVSYTLYPETVALYWFFGAFTVGILKKWLLSAFDIKQRFFTSDLKKYIPITIISSIISVIGVALWIVALRVAGPPMTSFLMKFQVVFSVILGVLFLNERLKRPEILGIFLTFVGGLVITYNTSSLEFQGSLFAIAGAFCYSCLFLVVRKMVSNLNMMTVVTLRSLGVAVFAIIYLVLTSKFQVPSAVDILYMLIGGTCGAYIGKACQFQAIKLVDISRTTAVTPLEAVFVVILTFIFFDTIPSTIKLIGGGLILIGILFLLTTRQENFD